MTMVVRRTRLEGISASEPAGAGRGREKCTFDKALSVAPLVREQQLPSLALLNTTTKHSQNGDCIEPDSSKSERDTIPKHMTRSGVALLTVKGSPVLLLLLPLLFPEGQESCDDGFTGHVTEAHVFSTLVNRSIAKLIIVLPLIDLAVSCLPSMTL